MKNAPILFLSSILIVICPSVSAGDPDEKAAKEVFTKAVQQFQNDEYEAAAASFRKANAIKFNWKLLYNIGQSEAAARNYGAALQAFEEYLARGGDEVINPRRDEVLAEIKRLREMIGWLEISGPDGAEIRIDKVLQATLPLSSPLIISSGVMHTVTISRGEDILVTREVRLSGQQSVRIDVPLSDEAIFDPPEKSDPLSESTSPPVTVIGRVPESHEYEDRGRNLRIAGYVVLATGAAMLVSGGITGGVAYVKARDLEAKHGTAVPQSEASEVDTINALGLSTDILLIGGGVIAATGAVLIIVAMKKKDRPVSLSPVVNTQGAVLNFSGRF